MCYKLRRNGEEEISQPHSDSVSQPPEFGVPFLQLQTGNGMRHSFGWGA